MRPLSYEEMDALNKQILKEKGEDSTLNSDEIEWKLVDRDNYFLGTLKKLAKHVTYAVEKQAQETYKDIKRVHKNFR